MRGDVFGLDGGVLEQTQFVAARGAGGVQCVSAAGKRRTLEEAVEAEAGDKGVGGHEGLAALQLRVLGLGGAHRDGA